MVQRMEAPQALRAPQQRELLRQIIHTDVLERFLAAKFPKSKACPPKVTNLPGHAGTAARTSLLQGARCSAWNAKVVSSSRQNASMNSSCTRCSSHIMRDSLSSRPPE